MTCASFASTGPRRSGLRRAMLGLVLLAGLLAAALPAFAATLTATLDRTSLAMGETVTLVLSLAGGDSSTPPDLSALAKDFEILDRRRGSRTTTVDGKRTQVNEWVMLLAPKRTGTLTVPALSVAGLSTQPVRLDVSRAPAVDVNEDRPLFVQLEVGKGDAYVQGEIPLTVRIYDALGMRSGALTRPEAEGASIATRGEQQTYLRTIGKKRYRVYQQDYVMTPQKSGTIHILPITLKAVVPGSSGASLDAEMARLLGRPPSPQAWLDAGAPGREINLHTDPVDVEVKPRPSAATGWFLPAKAVTLTGQWASPPAKAQVGDTLTRTIRLVAVGATPNQLPPLTPLAVEGLRQYEDESRPETVQVKGEAAAQLTQVVSVVPTRSGTFTLPAVEVDWWNTAASRAEKAVLPAETFTIAGTAPEPTSTGDQAVAVVEDAPEAPPEGAPAPAGTDLVAAIVVPALAYIETHARLVAAVAAGLLTLGLFLAVIWRHRAARARRRTLRPAPARRVPFRTRRGGGEAAIAAALDALAAAAKRNDARAAQAAYLAFLRAAGAPRAPALEDAARDLGLSLHGAMPARWRGRALARAVKAERAARRPARAPRGARLAPLYPSEG
ncbi:BatD family protein [Aquabacter sp. L1I39]|uniref:BatD family protein n=1 Tax=Aquabacter sp. L1I39 TaxID=2820278 RepID=UPI001ADA773B|nr:BatD family protein [Aquabacter sp. L1I39]QTL04045.1 BatD family protein [Aquabacter sp. L1I39]